MSERLPEHDQLMLLHTADARVLLGGCRCGCQWYCFAQDAPDTTHALLVPVTHWMAIEGPEDA